MNYEIEGGNLPTLRLRLKPGESVTCEAGAMSWMDDCFEMSTSAGGIGKMFSRAFSKESAFLNVYEALEEGEISFSSKFPGNIVAVRLDGDSIVVQKGAFIASAGNIDSEIFFQHRLAGGLFGGEGFIMRRYFGNGIVFLEVDGSAFEYELAAGEKKIVSTGHLAYMSGTCDLQVATVKGLKNAAFGGEGIFNTVVTGPGKVTMQSLPITGVLKALQSVLPHNGN